MPRLLVLIIFLILVPHAVSAQSAASILAPDQLVRHDQTARLEVRLVTGGLSLIQRPIGGERIEFLLKDRSLGQTLTGGDGRAVKSFSPPRPGLYIITVRLIENPRYEAEPVELIVAERAASHPLLLVHLSSTRAPGKPPPVPFASAPTPEAMPDAAKVLSELSRRFQLLYLESGHEALIPQTKRGLEDQGFPEAPLFVWDLSGQASARTDRLSERIQEFKDNGWRDVRAGISRSTADAEAFRKMKMVPIVMVEEDEDEELPEGAKKVSNWKAIKAALAER